METVFKSWLLNPLIIVGLKEPCRPAGTESLVIEAVPLQRSPETRKTLLVLRLSNWKLKLKEADLITGQEFSSELVIALKTILFLPDSHLILLSFTVGQQHEKTLWPQPSHHVECFQSETTGRAGGKILILSLTLTAGVKKEPQDKLNAASNWFDPPQRYFWMYFSVVISLCPQKHLRFFTTRLLKTEPIQVILLLLNFFFCARLQNSWILSI